MDLNGEGQSAGEVQLPSPSVVINFCAESLDELTNDIQATVSQVEVRSRQISTFDPGDFDTLINALPKLAVDVKIPKIMVCEKNVCSHQNQGLANATAVPPEDAGNKTSLNAIITFNPVNSNFKKFKQILSSPTSERQWDSKSDGDAMTYESKPGLNPHGRKHGYDLALPRDKVKGTQYRHPMKNKEDFYILH